MSQTNAPRPLKLRHSNPNEDLDYAEMRLLIVSPYFPPQRGAASIRLWAIAQQALVAGFDVDVLTSKKYSDQIEPWSGEFGGRVHEIDYEVPKIFRVLRSAHKQDDSKDCDQPSTVLRSVLQKTLGRVRAHTGVYSSVRMPDLTDYWVKPAIQWAREAASDAGPWDVVLSSSGPYTAHIAAMEIKRLGLTKSWVTDFRDLWTLNHPYRGIFPLTIRERWLERQVLRQVDAITTVSEPMANWLSARSEAPVEVVYNGYGELNESCDDTRSICSSDPIRLVYTGQLYPKNQNGRVILAAISQLREEGVDISLTVAGASTLYWKQQAQKAGILQAVELLGEVGRGQALELQRQASGLLALEWNDPEAGVLSSKLFEYISAGPVVLLTGQNGPMAKVLARTGRGVYLGESAECVVQALRDLIRGDRHAPIPNLNEIEQLSRLHQSKKLIDLCQQIAR